MKPKIPKVLSKGECTLAQQLTAYRIPFEREVKFAPDRKWKFDFVIKHVYGGGMYCDYIAIEVDGGTAFGKSRHSYGDGYEKDAEKLNKAAFMGWRVLRFTTRQVISGEAINMILSALGFS